MTDSLETVPNAIVRQASSRKSRRVVGSQRSRTGCSRSSATETRRRSDTPERQTDPNYRAALSRDVLAHTNTLTSEPIWLPGRIPFPLLPAPLTDFLGSHADSAGGRCDAAVKEVFASIDIPAFIQTPSVIREWEDEMSIPRQLPRGLEDRWRTMPPMAKLPDTRVTPKQFGADADRILQLFAETEREFERRQRFHQLEEVGRQVFVYSAPKDKPLWQWVQNVEERRGEEEAKPSAVRGQEQEEKTQKGKTPEDECEEVVASVAAQGVEEVCHALRVSGVRLPSLDEAVGMAAQQDMRQWKAGLSPSEKKRLDWLRTYGFQKRVLERMQKNADAASSSKAARRRPQQDAQQVCAVEDSAVESVESPEASGDKRTKSLKRKSYLTMKVEGLPSSTLRTEDLHRISRHLTQSESYKLYCDFGDVTLHHQKHMYTIAGRAPHVVVSNRIEAADNAQTMASPDNNETTTSPFLAAAKERRRNFKCSTRTSICKGDLLPLPSALPEQSVRSCATVITAAFYHSSSGHLMAEYDVLDTQTLDDLRRAFTCCDEDNLRLPLYSPPPASYFCIDDHFYYHDPELDSRSATAAAVGDADVCAAPNATVGGDEVACCAQKTALHTTEEDEAISSSSSSSSNSNSSNSSSSSSLSAEHRRSPLIPMAAVVLGDMSLPLLKHCVYCHQGDCEHRVTFTRIRTLNRLALQIVDPFSSFVSHCRDEDAVLCTSAAIADDSHRRCFAKSAADTKAASASTSVLLHTGYDCPYVEGYPLRTYVQNLIRLGCQACDLRMPTLLVYHSLDLPRNPTHLCEECKTRLLMRPDGSYVEDDIVIVPFVQQT